MENLSALEADALREVCNICCGHAATALSRLMGDIRVTTQLPEARRMSLSAVPEVLAEVEPWVWTKLLIQGQIEGTMALILSQGDAERMVSVLCGAAERAGSFELGCSALCEATNIAASASMNALSRFAGLRVTPGVPTYGSGGARELFAELESSGSEEVVVLTTTLDVRPAQFHGHLLLVPSDSSLPSLLAALGL